MSDLGANFRTDFSESTLLKKGVSRYHVAAIIGIPLAAILFQVYVPRFFEGSPIWNCRCWSRCIFR